MQHPKGGRPTPQNAGLELAHREELWERLQCTDDGEVFKPEEVLLGLPESAGADFKSMHGYDHVHVGGGWHAAIREGKYVRVVPDPEKVAKDWAKKNGIGGMEEYGDRTAWREKLYPWEPLAGYRYRTKDTKTGAVLFVGQIRIRITDGPWWLISNEPSHRLFRALSDMPHKTLRNDIRLWINGREDRKALLAEALAFGQMQEEEWIQHPSDNKSARPSVVARMVTEAMAP